jgi:hypothetical protein
MRESVKSEVFDTHADDPNDEENDPHHLMREFDKELGMLHEDIVFKQNINEATGADKKDTEAEGEDQALQQQEQEKQLQKILKAQEEERNKYILYRMDWDKTFKADEANMAAEMDGGKAPHMMSEFEMTQMEKLQIVKCGKILWRSIIFGLYMLLIIIVVQSQVQSQQAFEVNNEIEMHVNSMSETLIDVGR